MINTITNPKIKAKEIFLEALKAAEVLEYFENKYKRQVDMKWEAETFQSIGWWFWDDGHVTFRASKGNKKLVTNFTMVDARLLNTLKLAGFNLILEEVESNSGMKFIISYFSRPENV